MGLKVYGTCMVTLVLAQNFKVLVSVHVLSFFDVSEFLT